MGGTGRAKSTLVQLIPRCYEVSEGTLRVGGHDVRAYPLAHLRDAIGIVLQKNVLFSGTVRENLGYTKTGISDKTLEEAGRACGIYHFIETLPKGFDTVLDDSIAISAGQKLLFTIARAMVQDNPMLILDEATSSIDTGTGMRIQKAFATMMQGRTSFLVAHRLSTIQEADVILVMRDGKIVEQGNHEELLAANGFYKNLFDAQWS